MKVRFGSCKAVTTRYKTLPPHIKYCQPQLAFTMWKDMLMIRFDLWRRLWKKLLNDSLCVFHRWEEPSSATYNPTTYCTAPTAYQQPHCATHCAMFTHCNRIQHIAHQHHTSSHIVQCSTHCARMLNTLVYNILHNTS